MARYFNKTNGPLPLTLANGDVVLVPPKRYANLTPEQDGGSALLRALRKGFLVRMADPAPTESEEPEIETKEEPKKKASSTKSASAKPAAEPAAEDVPTSEPAGEPAPETSGSTDSSSEGGSPRRRRHGW